MGGEKIVGKSTTQSRTWTSAWRRDYVGCWSFNWNDGLLSFNQWINALLGCCSFDWISGLLSILSYKECPYIHFWSHSTIASIILAQHMPPPPQPDQTRHPPLFWTFEWGGGGTPSTPRSTATWSMRLRYVLYSNDPLWDAGQDCHGLEQTCCETSHGM